MSKVIVRALQIIPSQMLRVCDCQQGHKVPFLMPAAWSSTAQLTSKTLTPDAMRPSTGNNDTSTKPAPPVGPDRKLPVPEKEILSAKPVVLNVPPPKVHFYRRTLPRSCISFTSDEGKEIFRDAMLAGDMNCYFQLASQYRTQDEPAFCGLSTLVMVLNTLEVDPNKIWKGPWRWYHEDMLDCCIPLAVVEKSGITMDQFACVAACNMLNVKMVRTDQTASEEDFRTLVKTMVRCTDQVLVVTYSRAELGQTGDGHFSPIGGYCSKNDMVLIMDTARFKYPPHWVSVPLLFKAMQKEDQTSGLSRGYFLLSKSHISPSLIFRLSVNLSPIYLENKESKIKTFLQSWERLLMSKLTGIASNSSAAVVELAVAELLGLLNILDDGTFLLTAQVDPTFANEMSSQYGHCIRRLLSSIENLPVFQVIQQGISCGRFSLTSVQKAGVPGQSASLFSGSEVTDNNEFLISSVGLACLKLSKSVAETVTPVHFLTMLILSWPYHRCSGEKLCTELYRYTSVLLSQSSSEVQNEAARLRQQLTSILSYCKTCCYDECK